MSLSRRRFLSTAVIIAVPVTSTPAVMQGITVVGPSIHALAQQAKDAIDKLNEESLQDLEDQRMTERPILQRPPYFTFSDSMTIQRGISA